MSFCWEISQPFSDAILFLTSAIYCEILVSASAARQTGQSYSLTGLGFDDELLLLQVFERELHPS